ncbi:MAG: hypothetical protein LBG48_03065, partial [Rickettsiales bacterium]|nr:hypothetical protein [Rickettsiales bacterium]
MAFLTKRKSGQNTYYYLARSVRKNGVSSQEILQSFGTAENIAATFQRINDDAKDDTLKPNYCKIYQFGAVTALLDIANRLEIAETIDKYAPKRLQGLSVGEYMVLAAINRAVEPTSKNTFFGWFNKTV